MPLFKKSAPFEFTVERENIVRFLITALVLPPSLVFPNLPTVEDGSRPFLFYGGDSTDGLGAAFEEQVQRDGSIRRIAYLSQATLRNEKNWTGLDLEADCVIWRICNVNIKFNTHTDHENFEQIAKVGEYSV